MSNIDVRVMRARSLLVRLHAFFGSLAMRLAVEEVAEAPNFRTMATDGRFLYYCKAFLDRVSEEVLLFTVAHEVLHCALGHHVRRGHRDHKRWNIACDYVVNLLLLKAGFKVPDWASLDQRFDGMTAETVYRILEAEEKAKQKQQEQQQEQQQDQQGFDQSGEDSPQDYEDEDEEDDQCESDGQDGQGSNDPSTPPGLNSNSDQDDGTPATTPGQNAPQDAGPSSGTDLEGEPQSGSSDGTSTPSKSGTQSGKKLPDFCGDPGGCGEILDAAPPSERAALDEAANEWQIYTRQAVNIARKQGAGTLPGCYKEVLETLNTPQTDWCEELRQFVDPMSSTKDYTWTIPNRRYVPFGWFTPGVISDGINHVGLFIDSSSSIDTEWLRKFGSEAQGALDIGIIDKVTVIFADTKVQHVAEYTKGEEIDFTVFGRGGTAFSPTFQYAEENIPDLSAAIYFTDLDCTNFGPEPSYPVLWAVYGDHPLSVKAHMARVPWGHCIELQ